MTQQDLHVLMTAIIYSGSFADPDIVYTYADAANAATKCFEASSLAFAGGGKLNE